VIVVRTVTVVESIITAETADTNLFCTWVVVIACIRGANTGGIYTHIIDGAYIPIIARPGKGFIEAPTTRRT